MKSLNIINPIRDYLKHTALAVAMAAGLATPVNADPPPPPGGVTNLALWLDASASDTMTLSGTTVNEWRDKLGSTAKMTLVNGAPTVVASGIGGIPTVHFSYKSSMSDSVNHSAPVTIFYVSRQTGGTNQRVLSGNINNWLLGYWNGKRGSAYFNGSVILSGNGNSDTNPHLYATTIGGSGQNSTVWAEGNQIASNTSGTEGPNGLRVGGGGHSEEYSDCDISEVLVYNRILTAPELLTIGGYLTGKYGLSTTYTPPPAPTALVAAPLLHAVRLDWTASTGATGYNVYRGTATGTYDTLPIGTTTSATNYTDSTATTGGPYFYVVKATNSVGSGAPSNEASASPSADPINQTLTFALGVAVTKTAADAPFPDTVTPLPSGLPVTYSVPGGEQTVATVNASTGVVTLTGVLGTAHVVANVAGNADFNAAQATQTLTVIQATPVITWAIPTPIQVGTLLSGTQLNASSGGVDGAFVYDPPSGTALTVGTYTLSVQFTPGNTVKYSIPAAKTVSLLVTPVETTVIWSTGSGTWDTSTPNWLGQTSGAATIFTQGNNAVLNNSAGGTITIASGMAPTSTTVSATSGTYTFSGGPITTGSLTKSGNGNLKISIANNTYSGGTIINAGVLTMALQANAALGTGPVTLNSGTLFLELINAANALIVNGGNIYAENGYGDSWSGPVTLNANLIIQGASYATMTFSGSISGASGLTLNGQCPVVLAGANSFAGPVAVQAGSLAVTSLNRVSGGTATSNLGAPTTGTNGAISLGSAATVGTLLYSGAGETTDRVMKLAGATGGAILNQAGTPSGFTTTRGTSGLLKFTSDVLIPGTAGTDNRKTLTLTHVESSNTGTNPGSGEISGSIGDSLLGTAGQLATSITKAGSGTWTLSGSNTYSGATKVQVGTLALTRSDALGTGPLDITTGAKVQLDYIGTRQISALTFNAGAVQPNGTYGSSSSIATNKDDTRFSGPGTVTVGTISSSTTLARSSGSEPTNGGVAVTFTATVAGTAPAGSVSFYDGLTLIGSSTLNGSLQASFTTSTLGGGTHAITAQYVGNAGSAPSASAPLTQTVVETRAPTTTILTSGINPSNRFIPVTFTATVSGASPTGSVTFYDDTTALGAAALNGSAQASLIIANLPVGWRAITARYTGNPTLAPSASTTPLFQSVNPPAGNGKLKIFILAGQSNMQGMGSVETGRDPNNVAVIGFTGGLGSLRNMLNKNSAKYGYLADPAHPIAGGSPGWTTRSDVGVTYWSDPGTGENRRGNLDANFGNTGGQGLIGPEYGFGLQVGSQLGDQVLLIKYAFGGKSLKVDFRPPASGGTVGSYYTGMVARVNQVLANLSTYYPAYTGGGYEIVGFGWHQGWNDIGETVAEYETNLTNLIKDLRTQFSVPNLPVVIGNTGMANGYGGNVLVAQLNVGNPALHPEFAGTVTTVDTRPFDFGEMLGTSNQSYHWWGNAESYFNIGESMGKAMMTLLPAVSSTPFAAWALDPAQGLTAGVNNQPADDPDHDGIVNLLEFALHAKPLVSSQAALPALTQSTSSWVLAYDRSVASRPPGTTQIVEYGDDLSGWTQLTIPLGNSTNVTINPQGETDRVEVTLPALGAKGFARLKVVQ